MGKSVSRACLSISFLKPLNICKLDLLDKSFYQRWSSAPSPGHPPLANLMAKGACSFPANIGNSDCRVQVQNEI